MKKFKLWALSLILSQVIIGCGDNALEEENQKQSVNHFPQIQLQN